MRTHKSWWGFEILFLLYTSCAGCHLIELIAVPQLPYQGSAGARPLMRAHHSRSRRAIAARVVWARPMTRPPPPVPFKGQAGPRLGGLGLCGWCWSFCSSSRPSRRGSATRGHGDLPQAPARWAGPQLRVRGVSAALGWGARGESGLCRSVSAAVPRAAVLTAVLLGASPADPRGELRAAGGFSAARWVKLCRSESLLPVKLLE